MLESYVLPLVLGFIWGLAVSAFNNFWTWKALNNVGGFFSRLVFIFRQGINLLAMFLVYKNLYMLIGTAVGLLAIKNVILLKNLQELIFNRKG